jgi:phosphatidylglycerophosphatase A
MITGGELVDIIQLFVITTLLFRVYDIEKQIGIRK